MSDLWSSVPQVRWAGSRTDSSSEQKKFEPSVTANVAATLEPTTKKLATNEVLDELSTEPLAKVLPVSSDRVIESPSESVRTVDLDQASFIDSNYRPVGQEQLDPSNPQAIFADNSDDQIERLKAALNDDAERAKSPTRHTSGAHDVRVRVDSMLARARRLFDLGKLREARHAATIAHDLGDSARLDYSPDEERPIDLVQRIDDQLREATEQSPEITRDDQSEQKSVSSQSATSTSRGKSTTKPTDTDARPRRDWSLNVFRRERKTPVAESSPVQLTTPPTVNPTVVQLSIETIAERPKETDGAVVQANRSLTLVNLREATVADIDSRQPHESLTPIAFAPVDSLASRDGSFPETLGTMTDPEAEDLPPEIEPTPADRTLASESRRRIVSDESNPPPADFDEVKPTSSFRDVAGQTTDNSLQPEQMDVVTCTSWGWIFGIAAFGFCGIVAIFWYRRGAT